MKESVICLLLFCWPKISEFMWTSKFSTIAEVPLQKLKQRYNNPRNLNTKVNLQDLSEELRLRPPFVLCEGELNPGFGQRSEQGAVRSTIGRSSLVKGCCKLSSMWLFKFSKKNWD